MTSSMGVVSLRVPAETERVLAHAGIHPADVAKRAIEAEARRLRALEQLDALAGLRTAADRPAADLVREARDEA
jgi:hypothetical protein